MVAMITPSPEVPTDQPGRPAWIDVDLAAIAHNVRAVHAHLRPPAQLMAVVKANAYGHGDIPVAHAALEAGATWLGVNLVDEGVRLRQAGIRAPILILGHCPPNQAAQVVEHALIPTVNTRETAQALDILARQGGRILDVHIKVDTGLSRYGLLPDEVVAFARWLAGLPGLRLQGLWTHLACADEADKSDAQRQFRLFLDVRATLQASGLVFPLSHVANSAATIDLPEMHLDLVRCGLAIYGLYPSDAVSRSVALRPALQLRTRVVRLRLLPPGTGVSYGRTFVTTRPTWAALLPLGYGDGVPRSLSNRGSVLLHGKRAPIIGRICMDQFVVDVTDIPGVREGDEAVVIGAQDQEAISADELAKLVGTISYEIVTNLSSRLPRRYWRDGQPRYPFTPDG
jgi:alanine racemase